MMGGHRRMTVGSVLLAAFTMTGLAIAQPPARTPAVEKESITPSRVARPIAGLAKRQTITPGAIRPVVKKPPIVIKPPVASCPASALQADVVAIDHPIVFNRLGAQNVNWMMYALRHDVIDLKSNKPLNYSEEGKRLFNDVVNRTTSRGIALRPDLRPRPLVLRVAEGGYLKVRFTNLLEEKVVSPPDTPGNPFNKDLTGFPQDHPMAKRAPLRIDDQVASRVVGFHPQGLELVRSINDDSSYVGANKNNSLAKPGETREYCFFAPKEGAYLVSNDGAVFGGEGTAGNSGVGLFGAVAVEPKGGTVKPKVGKSFWEGSRFYRAQLTEEEMRMATSGTTPTGHPIIDYEAKYRNDCPNGPWCQEGKSDLPILNMVHDFIEHGQTIHRIVHGDINAVIVGPKHREDGSLNLDGRFWHQTYPLESDMKPNAPWARNPTLPNRLEPFREFVSVFHDENAATQAYPYFFEHPELGHTLHGVRDAFMINYGSGGIGAEIIANRLHSGPMHDCLDCAYEEFFLSSFAVGDAAMIVDYPANMVTHECQPEFLPNQDGKWTNSDMEVNFKTKCVQEKWATEAYYPHDPANLHHSYIGDFVKFRNVHSGKEQHIFHLHNHQWLFNPNDDNSNYIDAQGIGPGSGYTYEIAFGGSGNRNKTVGDAIFHCHFYPHFAQGMWYMWRNHDVFEAGTRLAVSDTASGFHERPFELMHGRPSEHARALPDGEIVAGTPIPAIVPLPGKGMAPMPLPVTVKPRVGDDGRLHGSVAEVSVPLKTSPHDNPGFPFWVAGVSQRAGQADPVSMGSRPTTPPLDMDPSAGGHDGGLPRHALAGYSAGGHDHSEITRLTAVKHIKEAKPVYYDEGGTPLEQLAMSFHAQREHPTSKFDMSGVTVASQFVTNGAPPTAGAPFNDPCIDDKGHQLLQGTHGEFFGGSYGGAEEFFSSQQDLPGGIEFGGNNPRVYKGANLQLDVVFNKLGYHYPQQRILTLWEDVPGLLRRQRPPEPLVLRMNTYDCAKYEHTNLVPKEFYLDDYQITTPTDVIGQHIHLPKWDLTSADGGANGFNYEDGTFSPGAVRERIHAINEWNKKKNNGAAKLEPEAHHYFGKDPVFQSTPKQLQLSAAECHARWNKLSFEDFEKTEAIPGKCDWFGARTTIQRWFSDPIVNRGIEETDPVTKKTHIRPIHRGLGITFTHDHLGPSTHQQLGLYATMLTEPPNSKWMHNESGQALYTRSDGGPTSWQAVITGKNGHALDVDRDKMDDSHREFFLQFGDFQHAYQKGVYVGVNETGAPYTTDPSVKPTQESFRQAINPSVRKPSKPVFPDIVAFEPTCPGGKHFNPDDLLPGSVYLTATDFSDPTLYDPHSGQPWRPCPEAISADDVGMMVVNYRNEPIGARVYDPTTKTQAAGFPGDLTFAMQTRTDRKIPELNTRFGVTPYSELTSGVLEGDPFTPIMRAYAGDLVRVKIQAGSHEHEHNGAINALAWMQGGSGFGQAPHSGWRNGQNIGLSEQFTLSASLMDYESPTHLNDRLYAIDSSQDGLWNGVWGVLRSMNRRDPNPAVDRLVPLPSNPKPTLLAPREARNPVRVQGSKQEPSFDNVCPQGAKIRHYHVAAVLANTALDGGTLVYNPRLTTISIEFRDKSGKVVGPPKVYGAGPLHDPTAILFVRYRDLDARGKVKAGHPVEPIVLRAAAGECIQVVLHNLLPADREKMPDLDGYTTVSGVIPRDTGSTGSQMTSFNNNLVRPSNRIGLHPQMVQYDVQYSDGNNVGVNKISTVRPGWSKTYQWYAGVIEAPLGVSACPEEVRETIYDELNDFAQVPRFQPLGEFVGQPVIIRMVADALKVSLAEQQLNQTKKPERPASRTPNRKQVANTPKTDIEPTASIDQIQFEEMTVLATKLVDNLGKTDLGKPNIWNTCFAGFGILGDAFPIGAGTDEPDSLPLDQKTDPSFDRNKVVPLFDVTNKLNLIQKRTECRNEQKTLPEIFVEQLEQVRREFPKNNNKWIHLVRADKAAQQFITRFFQDVVTKDVEGIDPGKTEKDAYAWRKESYPRISRNTTRLVKLDGTICRNVGVEFGGSNLTPPDRIKQGQKGAVGALVIEPEFSRWGHEWAKNPMKPVHDLTADRQQSGEYRKSRATATVKYREGTNEREFRESVLVHQKGLNLRYQDGSAVANLAAEKEKAGEAPEKTAPEDAHDSGHMAINYGTEPMWFRFGLPPDAPFGKEGFGGVTQAWQAFSQNCCDSGGTSISPTPNVGVSYTPIATVSRGSELRIRALLPTGVGRATTFSLHGHNWPRDPYLAEHTWKAAPGRGDHPVGGRPADWGVPSKCIGYSASQMGMGGQESLTPMAHFDVVLKSAGGVGGHSDKPEPIPGDYLWQDHGGFGITSGLWSLVRVVPSKDHVQKRELRTPCQ